MLRRLLFRGVGQALFGRVLNSGPLGRSRALQRIVMLVLMLPNSVVIGVVLLVVLALVMVPLMWVILLVGSATSTAASDLYYQCDSAIGPDPSATETVVPTDAASADATPESASSPADVPTTNPYASLTVAPGDTNVSDWQRACVSAMPSAPYQLPPLLTGNAGAAAACAQELAVAATQRPPSAGAGGAEAFAQSAQTLIYLASGAPGSGSCDIAATGAAPPALSPAPAIAAPSSTSTQEACNQLTNAAELQVLLPNTIAAQSRCGQRVDRSAVSAGDLIFWDYRDYSPMRMGIAVDATRMVTSDPQFGRVVEEAIPTASDVRVKRVLKGSS